MRAFRMLESPILFEVDSLLAAMQIRRTHPWVCRSESLIELHLDCVRLGDLLTQNNVEWQIRHVYREFNQVTDALANRAIDDQSTNGPSNGW